MKKVAVIRYTGICCLEKERRKPEPTESNWRILSSARWIQNIKKKPSRVTLESAWRPKSPFIFKMRGQGWRKKFLNRSILTVFVIWSQCLFLSVFSKRFLCTYSIGTKLDYCLILQPYLIIPSSIPLINSLILRCPFLILPFIGSCWSLSTQLPPKAFVMSSALSSEPP